jgi:hypothetical protein
VIYSIETITSVNFVHLYYVYKKANNTRNEGVDNYVMVPSTVSLPKLTEQSAVAMSQRREGYCYAGYIMNQGLLSMYDDMIWADYCPLYGGNF